MSTKVYQPTRDLYNGVIRITGGVGAGIVGDSNHGSGYHISRQDNPSGDYSIRNSIDKQGPSDGAAAIDISFNEAGMTKWTKKIMAGLDANDPRLTAVKEVIGTRDNRNVVRYTRTSPGAPLDWASSDRSHLSHIHISLFRKYINDASVLLQILDFLSDGASGSLSGGIMLPKLNDKGEDVSYWQRVLTYLGYPLTIDGQYGPKMKAAVAKWFKDTSGKSYSGNAITSWIGLELQAQWMEKRLQGKLKGAKGDPGKDGKDGNAIVSGKVTIDLNSGKVS